MKVFISGHIKDKVKIQGYYAQLESLGHEITHDWTRDENIEIKPENKEELRNRASKDLTGVLDCEVYALITTDRANGKGMYVELGAALANKKITGKPKIYVVGELSSMSVFYMHPEVKHCKDFDEFLKIIS
jgi:hypothetical protein